MRPCSYCVCRGNVPAPWKYYESMWTYLEVLKIEAASDMRVIHGTKRLCASDRPTDGAELIAMSLLRCTCIHRHTPDKQVIWYSDTNKLLRSDNRPLAPSVTFC
ncbi:hypothetical protein O3G_MSEX008277 [Manduca sexta]|uniref:Uncharacterized protein n=1 Tax=Manduca sexta TaxID=7130 RepID=A0A921Z9X0_MANSE|nr:hypothetical protein O3G_MSEX008277 [Manduca sexta]